MRVLPGTETRRRIYLMRHGHVDYFNRASRMEGVDEVALTPRGRMQAEAAGHAFSHIEFDRAMCSGLTRTRETAEFVLAQIPNAPRLEHEPGFMELRGGKMPPIRSREDLIRTMNGFFEKAHEDGATNFLEGEIFSDAQNRAVLALETMLAQADWHTALIVAHEGINRLILSWACGAGLNAVSAFEQDTGCINVIDFDQDGAGGMRRILVKAVNLTPYNYLKYGMNLTSLEALFEPDINDKPPG